jgi:hypothetical protein
VYPGGVGVGHVVGHHAQSRLIGIRVLRMSNSMQS